MVDVEAIPSPSDFDPDASDEMLAAALVDKFMGAFAEDRDIFDFVVGRPDGVPPIDYPDYDERQWLIVHLLAGYILVLKGRHTVTGIGDLDHIRAIVREAHQ